MAFRIELEDFQGPLDLLLYLVRKNELDITDIPIALITDQYLGYVSVLEQLDVNAMSEFVEMASTLIEIKSRMVLPRGGEVHDEMEDPRKELVERLLQYKKFKDAASMLEERSRNWQQQYPRVANEAPRPQRDLSTEPIKDVELWDLVTAMSRVMRDSVVTNSRSIVYDETPISRYVEQIHQRLVSHGRLAFTDLFHAGMNKSAQVGVFLAVLELVRHRHVRAEQNDLFTEIWVLPGENFGEHLDLSGVSDYEHAEQSEHTEQCEDTEQSEPDHETDPVQGSESAQEGKPE